MGLGISNIKFENGIPSFPEIQNKFEEQTGLPLKLVVDVKLFSLTDDLNQITERIIEAYQKSKAKSTSLGLPKSKLDLSKEKKNHLHDIRLETYGFVPIDFFVKENTIRLEFGDMDSYFLASLKKYYLN